VPVVVSTASIRVGFQTLRANPLRTVLSTLGVVIGVASLVAVLAIGDGMEGYVRGQIERTTDLQTIGVNSRTTDEVDGTRFARSSFPIFTLADNAALAERLGAAARASIVLNAPSRVSGPRGGPPRAAMVTATVPAAEERLRLSFAAGRLFTNEETESGAAVAVLSHALADTLAAGAEPASLVGATVRLQETPFRVIGILAAREKGDRPSAIVPFSTAAAALPPSVSPRVPLIMVRAARAEQVDSVRALTEAWLASRFGTAWKNEVTVSTEGRERLDQVRSGMMIFRLGMGTFAGISLIVGGLGIMNVLLASVVERTREIGVRKAIGARHRDILVQFLSESVAISSVGSVLGAVLGLVGAFAVTAIMRARTQSEIYAAFTWSTVALAAGISVLTGLAFGTYPALRAARLSPIDAIRHE
jgi:putative ABC transport system permease protein